jgi:NADPH-dependent 2,4-dienoyl-CoA reductase/sulfur reductase-like enzyme
VRTAPFSDYAQQIRRMVKIPVFAVDKIIYPEVAESLLREGKADFIAMGRASIADPELPNKARQGRLDEILPCIGCWQGCQGKIAVQEPVSCLVNPRTGKEEAYAIRRAEKAKKVMVIGGGPAGMEAAIVAAKRGHDVTLYDKADRLGGQWLLAAVPPGKEMLNAFTVWQKGELARSGVKVLLNTEVTAELSQRSSPTPLSMRPEPRRLFRRFPVWKSPLCTRRRIFFPGKSTSAGMRWSSAAASSARRQPSIWRFTAAP